jgi:hypothetical protein
MWELRPLVVKRSPPKPVCKKTVWYPVHQVNIIQDLRAIIFEEAKFT